MKINRLLHMALAMALVITMGFGPFFSVKVAEASTDIYQQIYDDEDYRGEIDKLIRYGASESDIRLFINAVKDELENADNLSDETINDELSDAMFTLFIGQAHARVFNAVFTGWDISAVDLLAALNSGGSRAVTALLPQSFVEIGRLTKQQLLQEEENEAPASGNAPNGGGAVGGGAIAVPAVTETKGKVIADQPTKVELQGTLNLVVPAGTLPSGVEVQLKVVDEKNIPASTSSVIQRVSPVVEMTTEGYSRFSKDMEVTFNINEQYVKKALAVHYYNEKRKKWMYIGGKLDSAAKTISIKVNHFTKFAVFEVKNFINFVDVPSTHWAQNEIGRLVGLGILKGYGGEKFQPNGLITRAEFAKIISLALDLPLAGDRKLDDFADKKDIPQWAQEPVAAAVEAGLIKGSVRGDKTLFAPNEKISRAEMAVIISRVLPAKKMELSFEDNSTIANWAQEGVQTAVANGMMKGLNGNLFDPKGQTSRAQAAAVINRLLYFLGL